MTSRLKGGEGQGFFDNITKASVIKSVTMGEGVSKNVQICVVSFMDDPYKVSKVPFPNSVVIIFVIPAQGNFPMHPNLFVYICGQKEALLKLVLLDFLNLAPAHTNTKRVKLLNLKR